MILTSKIYQGNRVRAFIGLLICVFFLTVSTASAQSALSLTVTPTIFEMTANPTQEWKSSVRVINPNPYEITVYADVVNFVSDGESGQGKFVPLIEGESHGQTIAEWVSITADPIVIAAEQTAVVPFSMAVPDGAPPGGHFAALLIGTKPPAESEGESQVITSQIITSLIFLRVTGDVVESGDIRSFRTSKSLLDKPEATFELRFENKGNVHILPQGDIKILNMWGQERGLLPINQKTMFGNVLPNSIRKYSFTWSGQWSLADIGRYTAVAALAYGDDSRQFASSETSFWVIPWKIMGAVLLALIGFFALLSWAIKLYIRKMLTMAGVSPELHAVKYKGKRRISRPVSVVAPIEAGILDLRSRLRESDSWFGWAISFFAFVKSYKIFFVVLVASVMFIGGLVWYVQSASVEKRGYEVTIEGLSEDVKISSEDVAYDELVASSPVPEAVSEAKDFPAISLINQSGVSGLAAELKLRLESDGYIVEHMRNDLEVKKNNTVIVYHPKFANEALELSQVIDGALLSAYEDQSEDATPITVYVGQDYENGVQ